MNTRTLINKLIVVLTLDLFHGVQRKAALVVDHHVGHVIRVLGRFVIPLARLLEIRVDW